MAADGAETVWCSRPFYIRATHPALAVGTSPGQDQSV